jgi:hypothetical protein
MTGWWTGDVTANDHLGLNNGTLVNGTAYATGMVGQAFSFDGVDDYLFVPNTLNIDGRAEATYDVWVYPRSTPAANTYYAILGAGDFTQPVWNTQQCRLLYWNSGSPPGMAKFYMDCGTNDNNTYVSRFTSQDYPINNWYSVAGIFNNGSLDIYVNGVLDNGSFISGGTYINTNANNYVSAGAAVRFDQSFSSVYFDGLIDEAEIYDRVLSPAEIQAVFQAGSDGKRKAPLSVPALNPWGMLIFMLLAGLGAVRYMRKAGKARKV